MKNFFRGMTVLTLALLIFPAVPFLLGSFFPGEATEAMAAAEIPRIYGEESGFEVRIFDVVSREIKYIGAEEFTARTLAGLLSPSCPRELLKAQAVLMNTYIRRRRFEEIRSPDPALSGCDVSTDLGAFPLICDPENVPEIEVFREIAAEVSGEYLSYGGEPCTVAYCYSAGTHTESAETVLGVDLPYLRSVSSEEPDGCIKSVTYTAEEVYARISTASAEYILLGEPQDWITIDKKEPDGYVAAVLLDGKTSVSGYDLAKILNLPSARFTFRYSPAAKRFVFTVSGSGSLVGMSQRGAAAMAGEGKSYREILGHFFEGAELLNEREGERAEKR